MVREDDERLGALGARRGDPGLTGAVVLEGQTRATVARGADARPLRSPHFRERLDDLVFDLHALSFFQTNTQAAERLIRTVRAIVRPLPGDRLLDLYCGAGTFALALAGRFQRVLGIDQVAPAIDDARRNALANGLTGVEFVAGDVEEWIREQEGDFDGVVVDPPRAGLHPRALSRLPGLRPRWILYVSCNPATLARDAAGLRQAGYVPESLQIVDLFPHTAHVESVLLFRRGDEPPFFSGNPLRPDP
ncbi:MAG: 23S rRNA (uracil(1939)-C(5))-methyltransferase RlmD [Candidatus Eisenbacteria bacterium]